MSLLRVAKQPAPRLNNRQLPPARARARRGAGAARPPPPGHPRARPGGAEPPRGPRVRAPPPLFWEGVAGPFPATPWQLLAEFGEQKRVGAGFSSLFFLLLLFVVLLARRRPAGSLAPPPWGSPVGCPPRPLLSFPPLKVVPLLPPALSILCEVLPNAAARPTK